MDFDDDLDDQFFIQKKKVIEQWVSIVTSFSSQYSTNGWKADQIIGKSTVYPAYGDNRNAWAPQQVNQHEFLEFEFEKPVHPMEFHVYETYNPGSLWRISCIEEDHNDFKQQKKKTKLSLNFFKKNSKNKKWITIWEDQKITHTHVSRINKISIDTKIMNLPKMFLTKRIRFDLNCTALQSWYEIDAIKMIGTNYVRFKMELSSLERSLKKAFKTEFMTDITFLLERDGKIVDKVRAHKLIICCRCEMFRKMFTSGMQENLSTKELKISNVAPEIFRLFLEYLYTQHVKVTIPQIIPLYMCADFYIINDLKDYLCEQFIEVINDDNVMGYLKICDENNCSKLKNICVDYVVENYENFASQFGQLSKELLVEICQKLAKRDHEK